MSNTNKGASSASHSATREGQSNHYRRTLRRRVHVGGNGSPGKSKSMVFSKDLDAQLIKLHSIIPMRIYISKIITMNNENSNEIFSI